MLDRVSDLGLSEMPRITKIVEQKRRPNRRNIHLDGRFAFGCNLNVVAKFRLREGLVLSDDQVEAIKRGEVQQECLDAALKLLGIRLHSQAELKMKLMRREYGEEIIAAVLDELTRLNYIDDARFARTKAQSAAEYKKHGRRRAMLELMKAGVANPVARKAVEDIYEQTDQLSVARELARKQAPRLRKLDPMVARRRLAGMLLRRGFQYDEIRPVIDEVLGYGDEPTEI